MTSRGLDSQGDTTNCEQSLRNNFSFPKKK